VATAVEDSKRAVIPETTAFTVRARWQASSIEHTDVLSWDHAAKAGDPLGIWVDADGNRADPPTPIARAATDAATLAIVAWFSVVLAVAQAVAAVRDRTTRARDAQWEREIRSLVGDDGGRTNSSQ
jgi:hypothetical protein